MIIDTKKELDYVGYDDGGVKILNELRRTDERMCFSLHWHSRMEILRIYSGGLKLNLGQHSCTVKAGELAVINPCQLHGGVSLPGGVAYRTIMFEIPAFINETPATRKLLNAADDSTFNNICADSEAVEIIDRLINEYDFPSAYSALTENALILNLLCVLYRICLNSEPSSVHENRRFRDVIDFINENYCGHITLSSLSKKFGYDEAYFCRLFKSVTGTTFKKYITIMRLEYAQKLLRSGEYPVAEVAEKSGYSDPGYFTRCFKEYCKMTPSEYISLKSVKPKS